MHPPKNPVYLFGGNPANVKNCVSLRTIPSTKTAVITEIPVGSQIGIYSCDTDGWYWAEYGSLQGYVNAKYIKEIEPEDPDCVIADDGSGYTISTFDNMPYVGTVYGYTGSTAEAFANKYQYKFQSLGSLSVTTEPTNTATTTITATTTTTTAATTEITDSGIGKLVISPVVASIGDAVLLCRYLAEDAPEPFRDDVIYDIDADGLLTIMDVAALLRKLNP